MSDAVKNAVKALEELAKLNNATWWAFEEELQKSPAWPEILYRLQRFMQSKI